MTEDAKVKNNGNQAVDDIVISPDADPEKLREAEREVMLRKRQLLEEKKGRKRGEIRIVGNGEIERYNPDTGKELRFDELKNFYFDDLLEKDLILEEEGIKPKPKNNDLKLESVVEKYDFSDLQKGFRFASSDGNYTILEKLGEGGQGPCYLSEDNSGRKRVLKFAMEKASDSEFEEKRRLRYMQVNEALGANYSLDRINPLFLLVKYNYIEGENTAQKQKKENKVSSEKEAIDFVKELCTKYLKPLHARGLVHGDIKPENVIEDLNGRKKLIDFELLRKDGDGLSTVNPLVTMAFNDITDKHEKITDYRALARMTYFLMTSKRRSEKDIITIGSPKTDDKMLSDLVVSDEFKKVLNKMLGYNSRYNSVDELVSDLERLDGDKNQLEKVTTGVAVSDKSKVDLEGFLEKYKKDEGFEKRDINHKILLEKILPEIGYKQIYTEKDKKHFRRIREDGTIDDLITGNYYNFNYERRNKEGEKELLKVKEALSSWLLGMTTLPARITKLNGIPALEEALKEVPYKKPTVYMDEKQFVEDAIKGIIQKENVDGKVKYYRHFTIQKCPAEELFYKEFDYDEIRNCKNYKEYLKSKKLKKEIEEIKRNASGLEEINSRGTLLRHWYMLGMPVYEEINGKRYRSEKKGIEKKLQKKQTELQKIYSVKKYIENKRIPVELGEVTVTPKPNTAEVYISSNPPSKEFIIPQKKSSLGLIKENPNTLSNIIYPIFGGLSNYIGLDGLKNKFIFNKLEDGEDKGIIKSYLNEKIINDDCAIPEDLDPEKRMERLEEAKIYGYNLKNK